MSRKKRKVCVSKLVDATSDLSIVNNLPMTKQTESDTYKIAFSDREFLLSDLTRGVRLQLEVLKTESILLDEDIKSTVVIFGSARIGEDGSLITHSGKSSSQSPKAQFSKAQSPKAQEENAKSYKLAKDFAFIVSKETKHMDGEFVVCTGGGRGVMEAGNRGASDAGARSLGLGIVLKNEQMPNQYITPELCFNFHYFAIRKMHFLMRAKVVAAFPGGYGTLDEIFEVLTLIQTGKMATIPVLLFNTSFWKRLINFDALVSQGTICPEDLSLFCYIDDAEQGWEFVKKFYKL